jgi:two-component system, OmpR family, response regulator
VTLRVFIVEDSRPARDALSDLLDAMGGFSVVGTVGTETDATEWLSEHRCNWDVAILDLLIDGGSGFNLIRRAKQFPAAGKTVVFSAYATPVIAQRCIDLGADAAFGKLDTDRLLTYLEELKIQGTARIEQRSH